MKYGEETQRIEKYFIYFSILGVSSPYSAIF
jgi:hypothetical protein